MLFFMYCVDKPDHEQVRNANRPAHLEYLKRHDANLVVVGPALSENAQKMIGSVFILDFPDRAAVDEFTRNDPYVKAGLFETTIIRPWRPVVFKMPPE